MTSATRPDSHLARTVAEKAREFEAVRDRVRAERAGRAVVALADYPWAVLEQRLSDAVAAAVAMDAVDIQLDLIDRAKFGGDVALKVPSLLKHGGPKRFVAEFQPDIAARLKSDDFADMIAAIELKGMYINITLTDAWLLRSAEHVVSLGDAFGQSDVLAGANVVVDYSSPNVAKTLHAGHIRSTIVGEVLSNIYDACGATVFRVNHINDFGGFGFILEGYRRFYDQMPADFSDNDRLLEVYAIRRTLERAAGDEDAAAWPDATREILARYFPDVTDAASARAALDVFTAASDARFEKLEAGDAEEVDLWRRMVGWSLAAFQGFYDKLNIDIDFVIGESFYLQAGLDQIEAGLKTGTARVYSAEDAEAEIVEIGKLANAEEITEREAETRVRAVEKDVGSTAVNLPNGERLVLLRTDGRSIYATRDIGAIAVRNELFDADRIVYVVGQEQRSHFDRLFAAAEVMGLVQNGRPDLQHVWFGFYVDKETGKKLSSRDSVSNVMALLDLAEDYFRARLSERDGTDEAERDIAARELTVGSLVFNDLKQDVKGSVDIDVSSLQNTVEEFERSGGAYVVYTACRARSILRRHGAPSKRVDEIEAYELNAQESRLLLLLQQTPLRVAEASRRANPTLVLRHLIEIAMEYNSYYTAAPVLTETGAHEPRLLITDAVQRALTTSLAICHIKVPRSI